MLDYFIVQRKLTMVSDAVGEYNIHEDIVQERLEEVLAMAGVDDMELVSTFVYNKTLFIIFKQDKLSPQQRKWREAEKAHKEIISQIEIKRKSYQHKLHKCDKEGCYTCEGGLSYCTVCGGAEGSLPTHCPGIRMSAETGQNIYDKELDFVNGKWVRIYGQGKEKTLSNKGGKKSRKT